MKLLEGIPIICTGEAGPDEAYVAEDAELERAGPIFSCSVESSRHIAEVPAVVMHFWLLTSKLHLYLIKPSRRH